MPNVRALAEENKALKQRVLELERNMEKLRNETIEAVGAAQVAGHTVGVKRPLTYDNDMTAEETSPTAVQSAVADVMQSWHEYYGFASSAWFASPSEPYLQWWDEWQVNEKQSFPSPQIGPAPDANPGPCSVDVGAMKFGEWRSFDIDLAQHDCRFEKYIKWKRTKDGWKYETSLMTVMSVWNSRWKRNTLQLRARQKVLCDSIAEAIAARDEALSLIGARIESKVDHQNKRVWWTLYPV